MKETVRVFREKTWSFEDVPVQVRKFGGSVFRSIPQDQEVRYEKRGDQVVKIVKAIRRVEMEGDVLCL